MKQNAHIAGTLCSSTKTAYDVSRHRRKEQEAHWRCCAVRCYPIEGYMAVIRPFEDSVSRMTVDPSHYALYVEVGSRSTQKTERTYFCSRQTLIWL